MNLISISSYSILGYSLLEAIIGIAEIVVTHGPIVLHLKAELKASEQRTQIEAATISTATADKLFFIGAQQIVEP